MTDSVDVGTTAKQAVERSRSFVADQLDQRSTLIGQQISATADDLRRVAGELRQSGTIGSAADLADRGAETIDRLGRYLQDADGDALIADAESFARERPWAVAAGALALGFAASRVLKASAARRYHGSVQSSLPRGSTVPTYRGTDDAFAGVTTTDSTSYAYESH